VKDDWEEDEAEEERPDVSSLQPIKKKSTVKQKIKEREEEEKRRAELGLDSDDELDDDPLEKRRREKEAQLEADIANAASLLGTSKISQGKYAEGEDKDI
jgi:translation initiation factor 3 subunit J